MKHVLLLFGIVLMSGCYMVQQQGTRSGATVYTTPGSPGGVSASSYTVTPL